MGHDPELRWIGRSPSRCGVLLTAGLLLPVVFVAPAACAVLAASAPASAVPSAHFLGFGTQSFRSPAPDKRPPAGTVPTGGTLRGCMLGAHAYVAFSGMRRGLIITYQTTFPAYAIGDRVQPPHTFVQRVPWRFTNELTGRAFYPAAIHLGKAFFRTPAPLDGAVSVAVLVGGRTLARGRVTVMSSCLPQAAFPPPTVVSDGSGLHAHFADMSLARDIVSRRWDFGDLESGAANTSTDAHPVHTYAQTGTYKVMLTVTDSRGRSNTVANRFSLR